MKKFIYSLLKIAGICLITIVISFLCAPMQGGMLDAYPVKHKKIYDIAQPKIVFVGGSHLSFGLDSKKIRDHFHMPVYNMGMYGDIGLNFMIKDIMNAVHKGDYIVISPEYEQFNDAQFYGRTEVLSYVLLRTYPQGFDLLSNKQKFEMIPNLSKDILIEGQRFWSRSVNNKYDWYGVYSFNEYGDCFKHWDQPNRKFKQSQYEPLKLSNAIIQDLHALCDSIQNKGATVIFLPPVLCLTSYKNIEPNILKIKNILLTENFCTTYDTKRYCYSDKYFFDWPYHCNREGIDIRTQMVIEDLQTYIKPIQ